MKPLLLSLTLLWVLASPSRAENPTNASPTALTVMTYNLRFASPNPPNAWP